MNLSTALVLGIALGSVAMLAILAFFRRRPELPKPQVPVEDPAVRELRAQVSSLRESTEQSLQSVSTIFSSQLQNMTSNMQESLATTTSQLGTRLDSINRQVTEQLNQSASLMTASTHAVGERVAAVQSTFAGLQKQIGEMTAQARQLSELSKSVTAIEHEPLGPGFFQTTVCIAISLFLGRDCRCHPVHAPWECGRGFQISPGEFPPHPRIRS